MADYIHSYDPEEQKRLITQAQYWCDRLLMSQVDLEPDAKVLDIGCGVGAVLSLLGQRLPELYLAGIDHHPEQIAYAKQYLRETCQNTLDLQVGDAAQLPWDSDTFDYAYTVWLLEHVPEVTGILKEAFRTLRPHGKICLTETDYQSLLAYPRHPNFEYFRRSLCELFEYVNGNPYVGRSLGAYLERTGFEQVDNQAISFHYWQNPRNQHLQGLINHLDTWLKLMIPQMVERLDKDGDRLTSGLNAFRQISQHPLGSVTLTIYRATGIKPQPHPET